MTEDKKVLVYEYDYDERFKKLLPFPKRNSPQTLLNTGIKFNWNFRWRPKNLTPETIEAKMVKFILDEINNDKKWNHIIKMDYKKKSKLFGIHLYHDDIVFVMDPGLCQLFGFKRNCYTKGTYWAQSPLTRVILAKINNRTNLNAFLIDLQAIEKQQETLIQSKESDKIVFTKTYEQQIKDGSENRTVKVSFGLHPQDGEIKISVPKDLSEILFFRFDDKTRRKLNLERIYYPGNKQRIKIPPILIRKGEKSVLDKIDSVTVDFFYLNLIELKRELKSKPSIALDVTMKCGIERPEDLLPVLNKQSKKYMYEFDYDRTLKRFEIKLKNDYYVLGMSTGLAKLLGFDPNQKAYFFNHTYQGKQSPNLKKPISALYVYSNIIDSVYIGNVKAPLLLTCPFKRTDDTNIVNQLDFINPTYVPLNRQNLNQIDIAIYDDDGEIIPFAGGKTKLNLHFRKRDK